MKDQRDRATSLILKKHKSREEREELREYLSSGLYKTRKSKWTFNTALNQSALLIN